MRDLDPTARHFTLLGLQWKDVGTAEPTEGRQLANAELAAALASKTTNTARLMKVFGDLDRNGNGSLSLEEFTPFAKIAHHSDSDDDDSVHGKDVQEFFNHVDTNSDGAISDSEFLAFFRQALECEDLDILGDAEQEELEQLLQKHDAMSQIQLTQEEVDAFGLTDLRSTDFVETGGRYFQPAASSAQSLIAETKQLLGRIINTVVV